jgi:hypothetical protein
MTKKEKAKLAQVPSSAEIASMVSAEKTEVDELKNYLDAVKIEKQADLDFAAEALRSIAEKHDALDTKRKSWVNPLNRVVKDINATFKPVLDVLKRAESGLKQKIGEYHVKAERERLRLLEEASKAASKNAQKRAESLIEKAELLDVEQVDGLGVKMVWTGEVVDAAKIPREYLVPDLKKLLAVTEAGASDPKIPGWRAWQTANVRTRRVS